MAASFIEVATISPADELSGNRNSQFLTSMRRISLPGLRSKGKTNASGKKFLSYMQQREHIAIARASHKNWKSVGRLARALRIKSTTRIQFVNDSCYFLRTSPMKTSTAWLRHALPLPQNSDNDTTRYFCRVAIAAVCSR